MTTTLLETRAKALDTWQHLNPRHIEANQAALVCSAVLDSAIRDALVMDAADAPEAARTVLVADHDHYNGDTVNAVLDDIMHGTRTPGAAANRAEELLLTLLEIVTASIDDDPTKPIASDLNTSAANLHAIYAVIAWWQDRATLAHFHAKRALQHDAGTRLAHLMRETVVRGIKPGWRR